MVVRREIDRMIAAKLSDPGSDASFVATPFRAAPDLLGQELLGVLGDKAAYEFLEAAGLTRAVAHDPRTDLTTYEWTDFGLDVGVYIDVAGR
jgi:hypothetical protein